MTEFHCPVSESNTFSLFFFHHNVKHCSSQSRPVSSYTSHSLFYNYKAAALSGEISGLSAILCRTNHILNQYTVNASTVQKYTTFQLMITGDVD